MKNQASKTENEYSKLYLLLKEASLSIGVFIGDVENDKYKNLNPKKWIEAYCPDMEIIFKENIDKKDLLDISKIKILRLVLQEAQQEYYWIQIQEKTDKLYQKVKLTDHKGISRFVSIKDVLGQGGYILQNKKDSTVLGRATKLLSLKEQLKTNLFELSLAAIFINIFSLVIPFFISIYFDLIIPNQASSTLITLSVGILLILIFDYLFKDTRLKLVERNAQNYETDINSWLYDMLFTQPSSMYQLGKAGMRNLPTEIHSLPETNSSKFILPLLDLVFSFIFILAIWLIGGSLVLISIACLIVSIFNGYYGAKKFITIDNARRDITARKSKLYNSVVSGYEVMNSAGYQKLQRANYTNVCRSCSFVNSQLRESALAVNNITQSIAQLQTVLVLIFGFVLMIDGNITGGNLFAVMLLSGRLGTSFAASYNLQCNFFRYRIAMTDVQKLLAMLESNVGNKMATLKDGSIELKQVSLNLEGRVVLEDIDLTVRSGEKIAILGSASSGKTMLMKLLASFYKPTSGELKYSGVNSNNIKDSAKGKGITYVAREPLILPGSFYANVISSINENIENSEVFKTMSPFVENLPHGINTELGEDFPLSYSELKSINITRGFLTHSHILLLDEPDQGFDRNWVDKLSYVIDNTKNKTIIASITNNDLLSHFDRAIILEKGKIVHTIQAKNQNHLPSKEMEEKSSAN